MSTASPVDPWSAGLRRTLFPEGSGEASRQGTRLTVQCPGGMGEALREVLVAVVAPEASRLGAQGVLPAVLALSVLRESGLLDPWDGLVHRRCVLSAAGTDADGAEGRDRERPASARARVTTRGGWELVSTSTQVCDVNVVHELARRLSATSFPDRSPGSPRITVGLPSSPGPGTRVERAACPQASGRSCGSMSLRLTRQDVARWSLATGDDNALHLEEGLAARYGIAVGGDEVLAHGLLLAALSMAALPPGLSPGTELRMIAPLGVGTRGVDLEVDGGTGEVREAGRCLLRRRYCQ